MKITERVVLGVFGTVVLTSLFLFALDIHCAKKSASQMTALAKAGEEDRTDADSLADGNEMDEDVKPSIGTREQPIVYQTQEQMNHTQEKQLSTAEKHYSGQADGKTAAADTLPDADTGRTAGTEPDTGKKGAEDASGQKKDAVQKENSKSGEQKKEAGSKAESLENTEKNTFHTVTEDYFSDAVFIGDSRTVGMQQCNLLPNATYYAKTGIGIGEILSQRIVNENGRMISVEEALGRHSFGKVYIMIGINDISRGDVDWFMGQYARILEVVHKTQPEAVIYIQGNIPMSYGTQDMNGSLNNRNLSARNEASRAFADGNDIFYLDVDDIFADGNGNLASIYTSDGLHVGSGHYPLWVDYLLHHAIVR